MMKRISLIIALAMSTMVFAQKDFEGEITYDIQYEDLSAQMEAYKSMLPSKSNVFVKGNLSKVVTPNGMGGETMIISDAENGETLTLINQMGNKIATKSNSKELEKEAEVEVEYLDETKEILGYKCNKALVTNKDGNEIEVFYTEELNHIKFSTNAMKVKGFPMQIIIGAEQFTMIQTVEKIDENKVKKFSLDVPSDYKLMTQEEIMKMQSGM